MEDERKGKPVTLIGGMYAKAKQRVLNKMGRRTTLTRNPRVDFISKRVEDIKTKKTEVTNLANSAKSQLKTTRKTLVDLDRAMLNAYIGELGERRWDEEKGTYTRVLHPEEKRLVADMERVLSRCMETMDRVFDSFIEHLDDTARKPLTFHTPEEDVKLAQVMQTKEEYKTVRTLYSDAMIDADADLAAGADLSPAKKEKVEETQEKYKEMSERLCEDAIKYEEIYREELAQRVTSHFTAEQQLLRGVSTAMKEFFPYTRGLTLNWEDMRATRRANLAAAKRGAFDEEDEPVLNTTSSLPEAGPYASSSGLTGESSSPKNSNPFSNITSTASGAAAAVAKQMTAKNVSNIIAQYAPGKKSSTKSDGLDKIKL